MKILNLTQHLATPDQKDQGVVDLDSGPRAELTKLLTFDVRPNSGEVWQRATQIADFAEPHAARLGAKIVMIGGAPFLMRDLEDQLWDRRGLDYVYSFSTRVSVDEKQADGSVRKVAVFRHAGFVGAEPVILAIEEGQRNREKHGDH